MGPMTGTVTSHSRVGKVELVLVGRSRDDDEASDDVGMIGRELYGHGSAEVVADDVGVGQAEVGAESVQKPAPVSYPVSGEWFVRLPETAEVEGIHGEACASRPASCSQMRDEDNQPCTSTTGGPRR